MKLLIQEDIYMEYCAASEEDLQGALDHYQSNVNPTLQRYGVRYEYIQYPRMFKCRIYEQKVTLDELAMNHLFAEVLSDFDYRMAYANIGGEGCDMALCLNRKQHNA